MRNINIGRLLCGKDLKLSDRKLGLLINFNVMRLKDGIKRMVNDFQGTTAEDAEVRGGKETLRNINIGRFLCVTPCPLR